MVEINRFEDFVGQEPIVKVLKKEIEAIKRTGGTLDHLLLYGLAGIGKSSLARILANELNYELKVYTKDLDSPKKVNAALFSMNIEHYGAGGVWNPGATRVLFNLEEAHGLKCGVLESLYAPMQSGEVRESGMVAWLPDFCLVATTTDVSSLPKPFRDRFGLELMLQPYTIPELVRIIQQRYPQVERNVAEEVAKRSRGTARLAIRYMQRVINYGSMQFFSDSEIDEEGLSKTDHVYLSALQEAGRPLSLNTLSAICRMSPQNLMDNESFLLSMGKIIITPQGRQLAGQTARGAKLR
jgi:Holliday junction DNA helicase RuvB